jgi:hypothetical protein
MGRLYKLGMDTHQVVARFGAERQALALMDHPNIAKVLDAGATDTGRPYFVMELVKGVPITKYCDQEKLGTKDRLDLFIKVCHAIQHAHQKGIIHRDIKPSNIMVTLHDGVPVPKVIDFGIAKATQAELTERTIFTQYSQFIGTPAYMSPEQAEMSGLDIDTRSDIYSLGVLLYELLTGTTPFDRNELAQSGLDEMRRIIREREPVKPSTRLSQTLESADVSRQKRDEPDASASARRRLQDLKGDLDWIVMKCLEKDRTRRYETANGLATDLKRHLSNEPVSACPPSTAYKLRKAFRRNKLVFTASVAVVAALVFGIGVSTWQTFEAKRAQRAAESARNREQQQRREADKQRVAAETSAAGERAQRSRVEALAYSTNMNLVLEAIEMNNLGRAQELLNRNRPGKGQPDRRGWEWRYLWKLSHSDEIATLGSHDRYVTSLAFSPSEDLLVSGDMEGKVRFWQWRDRLPAGELEVGGRVQSGLFRLTADGWPCAGTDSAVKSGTSPRSDRSMSSKIQPPGGFEVRPNSPPRAISSRWPRLAEPFSSGIRRLTRRSRPSPAIWHRSLRLFSHTMAGPFIPPRIDQTMPYASGTCPPAAKLRCCQGTRPGSRPWHYHRMSRSSHLAAAMALFGSGISHRDARNLGSSATSRWPGTLSSPRTAGSWPAAVPISAFTFGTPLRGSQFRCSRDTLMRFGTSPSLLTARSSLPGARITRLSSGVRSLNAKRLTSALCLGGRCTRCHGPSRAVGSMLSKMVA